jgi:hypothetical protein
MSKEVIAIIEEYEKDSDNGADYSSVDLFEMLKDMKRSLEFTEAERDVLKNKGKELRDILKDLITTSEDPTTWAHEMHATIDEVINEFDKISKAVK